MKEYEQDIKKLFYFARVRLNSQVPIHNGVRAYIYSDKRVNYVKKTLEKKRQMSIVAKNRLKEI